MSHSSGYKTKQREAILKYLLEHKDTHVTVNQISDYMTENGTPVGITTIYRHLDKLLEQESVRKYEMGSNNCACFQYAGSNTQCHEHFHLKCEKCGCLIHLECGHLNQIYQHIYQDHGFQINPFRTVFYGLCSECAKAEQKEQENNE